MELKQGNFSGWAVIEQMGHVRLIGFVETESFGGASLFRVDTPGLPERDYTLTRPEYAYTHNNGNVREWCPAGSKVKRSGSPASTKYVGPSSIYAITPCTEEMAREALEQSVDRPVILLEKPVRPVIAAATEPADIGEDACECSSPGCNLHEISCDCEGDCDCHEPDDFDDNNGDEAAL